MNTSQQAWTNVWSNNEKKGSYSFQAGRFERAQDKIEHALKLGVSFEPGERVLEAGCGDGAVIILLQKLFNVQGFGADFAETAKTQAAELMKKESCEFVFDVADIRGLPYPDNSFDKILCLGVVEHMEDPVIPLRELQRVLRPGGQAIIMTPNIYSAGALDRIVQQALGYWQMGFQREFSPSTLASFLESAGFSKIRKRAIKRKRLPRDSAFRIFAGFVDHVFNFLNSNVGFYSYTCASKD